MPFGIPRNRKEIESRMKTDTQSQLFNTNPFLRASFLGSQIVGYAGANYDSYVFGQEVFSELFPTTATGDFITMWGNGFYGIPRNPASQSQGFITVTGTPGSTIFDGTVLSTQDSRQYETLLTTDISANVLNVSTLTRTGSVATITTSSEHNLASGVSVTMAGADQAEYNITAVINVISSNQFTYTVAGTPVSPATGTITVSVDSASLEVRSLEFGQNENLAQGTELTFTTPIAGVDDSSFVQFGEVGGGTDIESDEEYRARFLFNIQNPIALFNVAAITAEARKVPGVTRVFVFETTPLKGQVTIYFMRDNDTNPIPSGSEVQAVKNKVLTIKPANTADEDVIVSAPTPVVVNFSFASITPDSTTMRSAISANLAEFFAENTSVGVDILRAEYESVIISTVDPETGLKVQNFSLIFPTTDVIIVGGEIGVLGTVTY
jgi:uncharacterized phage protein gp47/JayE